MGLEESYKESKNILAELECLNEKYAIEKTADQLEKISYDPLFVIDVEGFIRYTKDDVLCALDMIFHYDEKELLTLPAAQTYSPAEIKSLSMKKLANEFKLLEELRRDKPEAWDRINELYEDD